MTSIFFVLVRISSNELKCKDLGNKKLFIKFLLHCWNLHSILNILKKNMTLIANVFRKLRTARDVVRQMSKKALFRTIFDSQDVKGTQAPVKSAWQHFYHIFSSLWGILSWRLSFLVIYELLGLLINRLTGDDNYSFFISENLPQPHSNAIISINKTFFSIFWDFLEFRDCEKHG